MHRYEIVGVVMLFKVSLLYQSNNVLVSPFPSPRFSLSFSPPLQQFSRTFLQRRDVEEFIFKDFEGERN
jgi:hypothetical protein